MPNTWTRLWEFEERTTGKVLSWKGLKVAAGLAVAGALMDKVTHNRLKVKEDETPQATTTVEVERGQELPATPPLEAQEDKTEELRYDR